MYNIYFKKNTSLCINVVFCLLFLIVFSLFSTVAVKNVYASDSRDKDDVLIYANKNGEARGYDLLWKTDNITGTFAQESSVAKKGDLVFVTSMKTDTMPGNRDIFALDAYTGEIVDQYEIGPTFGDVLIDDTTLYISTGDESWGGDTTWSGGFGIYSFDISDVRTNGFVLNWFNSTVGRVAPNMLLDDNNVYFASFEGTKYYALARSNGAEVWSFTKGGYGAAFEVMVGDYIYVANSYSGADVMYKLNKSDGTQVWSKPITGKLWDNSLTYSSVEDALFFVAYYDGSKRAASYDLDGNQIWTQPLNCASLSFTSYHNGSVFFSDLCGWVYSLNATTGAIEWSTQIGLTGNQATDIASPVIANGQIFIGTKGSGYTTVDTKGRGAFYILDEETGEVLWHYKEDVGDVMALASIVDGIFYNVTNAWEVFAFDIGDGTSSDLLISTYDTYNTFSTETGLTQNKYVKLVCTTVGDITTCSIDNLYSGRAVETKLKMENEVIDYVMLSDGDYHINVDEDTVYLPNIDGLGNISDIKIATGGIYGESISIPRLASISPSTTNILESSYDPDSKKISLLVDNTNSLDITVDSFKSPFLGLESTISSAGATTISASNLSGVVNINSVGMEMTPSVGSVVVSIEKWESDHMKWTENSATSEATTIHSISGLNPNSSYYLKIDGKKKEYNSNNSGLINFNYDGGYSEHIFELIKKPKTTSGSSIYYGCKDDKASNYEYFARHDQSLCKYGNTAVENKNNENDENKDIDISPQPESPELLNLIKFTQNLKKGNMNEEVRLLQKLLNSLNFVVSSSGPGSPGNETNYFGPLTQKALIKFQLANGLKGDGIVGPLTRSKLK